MMTMFEGEGMCKISSMTWNSDIAPWCKMRAKTETCFFVALMFEWSKLNEKRGGDCWNCQNLFALVYKKIIFTDYWSQRKKDLNFTLIPYWRTPTHHFFSIEIESFCRRLPEFDALSSRRWWITVVNGTNFVNAGVLMRTHKRSRPITTRKSWS